MTEKKHFDDIDSIRFIAACVVFVLHTIYITDYHNGNYWYTVLKETITKSGIMGVYFFLVMSGYFIFYLLLKEKVDTKKINISRFIIKRAKRILPIYYVVLIIGFLIIPIFKNLFVEIQPFNKAYSEIPVDRWYYYLFFMVDFDLAWNAYSIPVLSFLWSVCLDVKFYLIAPFIIKYLNKKQVLLIIMATIVVSGVFRIYYQDNKSFFHFHPLAYADMIAVGALYAFLVAYQKEFIKRLVNCSKWMNLIPYIGIILIFILRTKIYSIPEIGNWVIALEPVLINFLFGFIIIEQCYSNQSIFKFGKIKWMQYLGVRTYGIYGFHLSMLYFTIAAFKMLGLHTGPLNNWVYLTEVILTFVLTIIAAIWFYNKVEKPIIENKFFWKKINSSSKPRPDLE